MDPHVEEIFIDALELRSTDRESFLQNACEGNPGLRQQIDRLLADAEKADAYFTKSFGGESRIPPMDASTMETEGDCIGPYELLHELGEGGFGVVWLAEQREPIIRQVAVKVVKAGMDTRQVLARFNAERQALARMDHPNIARVIDAGITPTGRPYFAMELVKGISITRYCGEKRLDPKARLKLFSDVCEAIHHAHQKGVIHRDIKPSNILVADNEGKPQVKVIDFGIAKAIEGRLTDATMFTRAEQLLGTPLYMSPEQAGLNGQDVDTRSDIYGLGVLLYELLTGVPPFDQTTLLQAGYEEMRRIIREVDPVRPSLRLTSLHTNSNGTAKDATTMSVTRQYIPSDLDWIVMKAIEKSPDRRYETVNELAQDIFRFLADEPVSAKPPSTLYLFRKFTQRHRTGVMIGSGFVVLLFAASLISTWQAVRATRAEALADQRLEDAVSQRNAKEAALQDAVLQRNAKESALQTAISERNAKDEALQDVTAQRNAKNAALDDAEAVTRLLKDVFQRPNPEMDGRKVTVMAALDAAGEKLDGELDGQPERLAMLKQVLAETHEQLAIDDKSLAQWEQVLAIRRKHLGNSHPDSLHAQRKLTENHLRLRNYEMVVKLAKEEDDLICGEHGKDQILSLPALKNLAEAAFQMERYELAKDCQLQIIERALKVEGPLSQEKVTAEWHLKRYERAQQQPSNPKPTQNADGKSETENKLQLPQSAIKRLESANASLQKSISENGEKHRKTAEALFHLANCEMSARRHDDAIRTQNRALAIAMETCGALDPLTLHYHAVLARMYISADQRDEGIKVQQRLLALLRERDGDGTQSTIHAENTMLRWVFYSPGAPGYLQLMEKALERRTKALGAEHVDTLAIEADMVLYEFGTGKLKSALAHAEHSSAALRKTIGENDRRTLDAMANLARCYTATGKCREAMEILEKCGPKMKDDTFVNFLLAQLQIWYGKSHDYNMTRNWMMEYGLANMDQFHSRPDILRRIIYISCLAPFADGEQPGKLAKIARRADIIEEKNKDRLDFRNKQINDVLYQGMYFARCGKHKEAIASYDTFISYFPHRKEGWATWDKCQVSFLKAISLHHTGKHDEGKALFQEAERSMRPWSSDEQPLYGFWAPSGEEMPQWLAFKEGKNYFN